MIMNNKVYDFIKWFCIIVSPGLCTVIVTLNNIWHMGIPAEEICGTITCITTFLGIILGFSNAKYKNTEQK